MRQFFFVSRNDVAEAEGRGFAKCFRSLDHLNSETSKQYLKWIFLLTFK